MTVSKTWRAQTFVWLIATAAGLFVLALLTSRTANPRPMAVPAEQATAVSAETVKQSIQQADLQQHLDVLSAWPTRIAGTAGFNAVAEHVRSTFATLDMRVLEQPFTLVVPVTRYCQILDENDEPIPGVSLSPFWPNLVRTCTIPPPGLTGQVVMGTEGGAFVYEFTGVDPASSIPLVAMSAQEEWIGLADAGFPAVIFYRDDAAQPRDYQSKELKFPANFPRFYLTGDPQLLHGRRVRIRCRVDWQQTVVSNIVGVLEPAAEPATVEALILAAHYDSISPIPDVAPGAEDAAALVSLLTTARFAAEQRHQLTRPMVFIALAGHGQACSGARQLASLWGSPGDEAAGRLRLQTQIDQHRHRLALIEQQREVLADDTYWSAAGTPQSEKRYWHEKPQELQEACLTNLRRVIEQDIVAAQEKLLAHELARKRRGQRPAGTIEDTHYEQASDEVKQLRLAITAELYGIKAHHAAHLTADGWIARARDRLAVTQQRLESALDRDGRCLQVQNLLHGFDRHVTLCLAVTSGAPSSALLAKYPLRTARTPEGSQGWMGLIAQEILLEVRSLIPPLAGIDLGDRTAVSRARNLFMNGLDHLHDLTPQPYLHGAPYTILEEYPPLLVQGRHAIGWVSQDDPAAHQGTPEDTFDRLNLENLLFLTRVIAGLTTRIGAGRVQLDALPHPPHGKSAHGQVLQAADPNSVIPTRGVEGAIVIALHRAPIPACSVRQEDVTMTNEDGRFHFLPRDPQRPPEEFQVFRIDPQTGQITAVKDQGGKGEGSFPSARTWNNFDDPLRLVLFRCAQTDLFYPLHPSKGSGLGSAFAVDRRTLGPPQSYAVVSGNSLPGTRSYLYNFDVPSQGFSLFNPPATSFYVGLRDASPLDPSMQAVVSYLLGAGQLADSPSAGQEIWGPGYLAADTDAIHLWQRHAAQAMTKLDGHRLRRQQQHRIARPMLVEQHQQAAAASERVDDLLKAQQLDAALHAAQDSLAISMEVYPRIARTEQDAVTGVLFYLFIIIPFAIFLERLIFGFSDIRGQIAAVTVIFAMAFVLLNRLHPAFALLSSSLMVLIGFLTLSMSLFVTIFLGTRFRHNIHQLRMSLQRSAEAADVNRVAAAITAFLLGINNMRKRKVRTIFTCMTLVLVTFALLSLTAVQPSSQFKRVSIGSAPYTGLLIKGTPIDGLGGTTALAERFGREFTVSQVVWRYNSLGILARGGMGVIRGRPSIGWTEQVRLIVLTNTIGLSVHEPKVTRVLEALVAGRWFAHDAERAVLLPTTAAYRLGITPEMAEAEKTTVYVDDAALTVIGLFDPDRLERVRDLDGQSLLPYDGSIARQVNQAGGDTQNAAGSIVQEVQSQEIPRLPGSEVVIMPVRTCRGYVHRLAVNMNDAPPETAMAAIGDFLKRWESFVHFGVGGIAYYGRIVRGSQLQNLVQVLVPLLIASAIVLNTLLGSVYERTGEIGVYSAVGLSPTHVRYLFAAEACVYATVSAVGGYFLAHGVGKLMVTFGWTGGLSFNYSTSMTVYATLAMMGAVLASTWYPARQAAKLAMASQQGTIRLPQPRGDQMQITLPFTYVELDAIGVMPFLYDMLDDHGESSAGGFFCDSPQWLIEQDTPDGEGFGLRCRCWLKPYDLGVSQTMTLAIRPSSVEGVWSANLHLQRLTGKVDAWQRVNAPFVVVLRKHLLAWRGLADTQKDAYLARGMAAMNIPIERFLNADS